MPTKRRSAQRGDPQAARLRPLDRVLVAVLVSLWAACFVLSIHSSLRGLGLSPVYVTPGAAAEYPTPRSGAEGS